jgi:type II secretory ATPase GspE/PulE/Tfp pilus assembly ATPase PilB-like protein
MEGDTYDTFVDLINRPHGIILVTGPTGSGKTTSLYAALKSIVSEEIKILTIEDPIEYYLEGVNQTQVISKIGMTFARAMRSFLRHDPDVILVGEIRDKERPRPR